MSKPVTFGLIGGGWRAEFYVRVARALPERFRIAGCVAKTIATRARIQADWNLPVFDDPEALLKERPDFLVTSVPWAVSGPLLVELAAQNVPVLAETPPAADLAGLNALWQRLPAAARVQVAEQYAFQPLHAARLAFVRAGTLGAISQVQVSVAHGYHGVSLIRKFLDLGCENAVVRAFAFTSPVTAGPTRSGPPAEDRRIESRQVIATFQFGEKLAIFDFTADQYFSWIRSGRLLVRGERGEINNLEARYLSDFRTPLRVGFERQDTGQAGNLEGYYHAGYTAGGAWWYRNPFVPGRLSDDEIAIATCLESMGRYVETGQAFYSVAEAAQDHYLSLLIDEAVQSGNPVESTAQSWG
ncbi:MAG TPA: Gfo/Idh/MocA family oxidoreductase [Chthoniobacterales bacterium]